MEQPAEVILAQAGLGRSLLEVQRRGVIIVDEFDSPFYAKMGQRVLVDEKGATLPPGRSPGHDPTFWHGPDPLVLRMRVAADPSRACVRSS